MSYAISARTNWGSNLNVHAQHIADRIAASVGV